MGARISLIFGGLDAKSVAALKSAYALGPNSLVYFVVRALA